ncbi:M48 family metallopeptidase, partial [bacterium]|nr:M48 family metallopeptidase [bacterium]
MYSLFPESPKNINPNFTQITSKYKKKVWVAFASLCVFVLVYFALITWFTYQSYYLINNAIHSSSDNLFAYFFGICSIFLTLFLIKGLFFVRRGNLDNCFEITKKEQPELFRFIYRIADEAGAPRPYKVFLSADVNACVFYNLSLLDLILPTKKNLEIGLGLVNVLTLGELKAVIAHEFGHFSQKSMVLGTWVYVAQQVASHLIHQRDAFDRFLSGFSRSDLRIAWIAWILNLIVWSLRSLLDIAFRLVVIAQRSLSREMEMHADKVAVSLTGSDELIHALHKLNSGDICWDSALDFAHDELVDDSIVEDIFEVQSALLKRFREIYNDNTFNEPPKLPSVNAKRHRVFKTEFIHPPKMWATHPSNYEREKNAKEEYVFVELDIRSSWELFSDKDQLKLQMTKHMFQQGDGIRVEYVDPANVVYSYTEDPYFKDCLYWVELKTVPITEELKINPDLTEEDLKEISQYSQAWYDYYNVAAMYENSMFARDSCTLLFFNYKSTNSFVYKKKQLTEGTFKTVEKDDEFNPPEEMMEEGKFERVEKRIDVWYDGVMVMGSNLLLKWELMENMVRPNSANQYAMP